MQRTLNRVALALSAFAFSASACADVAITSWLAPVDGAFGDRTRWSNGVPNIQTAASFGIASGDPFTVTVTGPQSCEWLGVVTQSLTLDGARGRDASVAIGGIYIQGSTGPSLTIRNCTLTCNGTVAIGANGMGSLHVADGGSLQTTDGISIGTSGAEALLDLGAHAIVNANYFYCAQTTRWTIDGADACFLNVVGEATHRGTIRIAFGPNGPPSPGTVVPLASNIYGCDTLAASVVVEENGRPIDAIVGIEADVLVYRQLVEPLQLIVDAPPMPSAGFHAFISVTGYADGHTFALARQATLSSSDPSVLQVVGADRVFGVAPGRAILTASLGSASESAFVTIGNEPLRFAAVDDTSCDNVSLHGISRDGRFVVFEGVGSTFVANDTNGKKDVFVRDLDTGVIERASEGPNGEQGSKDSFGSLISGDGRFVAFQAGAAEIAGVAEMLVMKDRMTGSTEILTVAPDGTPVTSGAVIRGMSNDGRYVAFSSDSTALLPGLSGNTTAFIRDRLTATTSLVGIGPNGTPQSYSMPLALSSDGRFVAFFTLYAGKTALMVRDLVAGVTTLDDVASFEAPLSWELAGISDDGQYVAFAVGDPGGGFAKVLLRDRLEGTTTEVASLGFMQGFVDVSMSANGRYIAFHKSSGESCLPGEMSSGNSAWRYDRVLDTLARINERVGAPPLGETNGPIALSGDGRFAAFWTSTDDLLPPDSPCISILRRRFGPINGADIDGDGAVNASDLALLLGAWDTTDASADLDGDGVVGASDLAILLGGWSNV